MKAELKHALIAFFAVAAAVALLNRLDFEVAVIGHVGGALVAVTLLYAPVVVSWRRREDLASYGFTAAPLRRGLAIGLGVPLLVFPLFAAGYYAFFSVVCTQGDLGFMAPPGACLQFDGAAELSLPALQGGLAQFALVHLVVVALPEELFFRGCLLYLLEKAIPPRRRIMGGGVGWALVISAAMFALIHLPRDGDLRSLATFFPGLLFGWMRSATGHGRVGGGPLPCPNRGTIG